MNEEIWRDIKNYAGKYQVSNMGRVKSLERVNSLGRRVNEKILRPQKNGCDYLRVGLAKEGGCKWYCVHRLVLSTFSPVANMENLEVNHLDENKTNNNLSNLEWTTHEENCNHGTRNKRAAEKNTNGKKSIPIVQLDPSTNKIVNVWKSSQDVERIGGYKQTNITQCCKNRYIREGNNIYKGFRWCYLYEYISNIDSRIKKVILFDKEYHVN